MTSSNKTILRIRLCGRSDSYLCRLSMKLFCSSCACTSEIVIHYHECKRFSCLITWCWIKVCYCGYYQVVQDYLYSMIVWVWCLRQYKVRFWMTYSFCITIFARFQVIYVARFTGYRRTSNSNLGIMMDLIMPGKHIKSLITASFMLLVPVIKWLLAVKERKALVCKFEPHKNGTGHSSTNCSDCPEDELKRLFKEGPQEMAKNVPSNCTCQQSAGMLAVQGRRILSKEDLHKPSMTCDLKKTVTFKSMPSCSFTVSDQAPTFDCTERRDDGTDSSLVSPHFAEATVVKQIGSVQALDRVSVQFVLAANIYPQKFKYSRIWKVLCRTLQLTVGHLSLLNISLLVSDDSLACKDLLLAQAL